MGLSIGELRSLHATLTRNEEIRAFYERLPRTFLWGTQNLNISTTIIQQAADTRDLVWQMQRLPLFGVNTDTEVRHTAVEWLIRKYESCGIDIGSFPVEIEESPYSCPDISILRGGRHLSVDFLRTLAIAHDVRRYLQGSQPPLRVVELGAGLGHLARTLRLCAVSKSHVILDLPETLIFSRAFLALNFPDASAMFVTDSQQARQTRAVDYDFVFVPSCFAELIDFSGVELFLNTCSLGEMNNSTIRYWMDFLQQHLPVKYLFTQNRFLNTIDPSSQAWRWDENECSVHYDSSWNILKWDLEPPWYQCPYVAPLSARSVDIVAVREGSPDPQCAAERATKLLEEVKQEDWFRLADTPADMTVRQNRFVTDVTMTGALFKLWECVRLHPTVEAVWVLLRYLETLIHEPFLAFEETAYYQQLFLKLAENSDELEWKRYASVLKDRCTADPVSGIALVADTPSYNILSVDFRVLTAAGQSIIKKYYAIAKALGPVDLFRATSQCASNTGGAINLFRERIGERELPGLLWASDTLEAAIEKAKKLECEQLQVRLEGVVDGYNIVVTQTGYLAVAQSLGTVDLFRDRVGEKELAPVLLKARTYEEIRRKIASRS